MQAGIHRRKFLYGTGVALLPERTVAEARIPIVDTHVHFYDPSRPQGVPWPAKGDSVLYKMVLPASYVALVKPLGVESTVVVEASEWLEDNQWVLDLAENNPVIVGFVGNLQPGTDDFRQHLARFRRNPLFRGIRVGGARIETGISQPAFVADLQRLADANLSLDVLGAGSMLSALLRLTGLVPGLRLVIDHMPVEPPGWQQTDAARAAVRELAKRPNAYAKVSGVLRRKDGQFVQGLAAYKAELDELWSWFGEDRVIYGSNWPVSNLVAPYVSVLQIMEEYLATRGAAAAGKFFRANSKACYRWIQRT